MSAQLLELDGVSRAFGGLRAVDGVSLALPAGARHGLIGPNGAGKSTLFKLIGGAERVTAGRIRFAGEDVTAMPEHQRARRGIAQTFQHSKLFLGLTCRENIALALQRVDGTARRVLGRRRPQLDEQVDALLERTGLAERRGHSVASLSHGERRQLEVAIALGCSPRLMLLDEPAAGMSPAETDRLAELIRELDPSLTVLVIEHDLDFVFRVARTVSVLHLGSLVATGPAAEVRDSAEVARVYLGGAQVEDLFLEAGA
ncbi:MAG: ABC transporter ATP-binding protein [Actinomycetota bacterium]|nr:ABC transporter ATP-binding protein [Actinomycetota bacterium]